jgi:LPS-assembly lipoprotein
MRVSSRATAWLICLTSICLLLSGCGFHLRGSFTLAPPLKLMYLQTSDPYGELAHNLRQSLAATGVVFTDTPRQATTILEILHENTSQQLLSVGGTQQTRQYNLVLSVVFQVTTPQGKMIIPQQTVSITQALTIQADQILGGSNEENNLYHQMRKAIIYTLLNVLTSKEANARLMAASP